MEKEAFGRYLLVLRYNPIGHGANRLLKERLPFVWSWFRDIAILGHRPSRPKRRKVIVWHTWFFMPYARLKRARKRQAWIKAYAAAIRSKP